MEAEEREGGRLIERERRRGDGEGHLHIGNSGVNLLAHWLTRSS